MSHSNDQAADKKPLIERANNVDNRQIDKQRQRTNRKDIGQEHYAASHQLLDFFMLFVSLCLKKAMCKLTGIPRCSASMSINFIS